MKGIVLAGGKGTRLFPITKVISKQLLPVYDKPLIYYPLWVLMLAGIREILIISTPDALPLFKKLFDNGSSLGISIEYKEQKKPEGIAQAFIIAEDFIGNDSIALILGDNIFFGAKLEQIISKREIDGGNIFAYRVKNPSRYGVVDFDNDFMVTSIEEKPKKPKSNYVVPGLYFYDADIVKRAKLLTPSQRGEYEITDLNNSYLRDKKLKVHILQSGITWLDAGTFDSLLQATHFVQMIEERQGVKIGCIEEIAYRKNWIDRMQLLHLAKQIKNSEYGRYLMNISS